MNWQSFPYFAIAAVLCWLAGTLSAFRKRQRGALVLSGLGSAIFLVFIIGFWMVLDRPPLRTMGETRLWYSFFLSVVGIGLYSKCRYPWMLGFSTLMSLVFTLINILKPEIHSQTLMPALQSLWFVPHVIVYMFSYAMLGAATLFALYLWLRKSPEEPSDEEWSVCDSLVRIGWAFLSLGMTMGALWAKEAWGDYWTWDPKETWALATWFSYLLYLHLRPANRNHHLLFAWLTFSFILLQMCWWGINLLPSAQGVSVHTY
ncbi:MAG: cytochrome c biogenesis protein CcsA [Bacteroidaceae bacterium]|nr:cytochrome c biogenesis protein CcsA [Bacteroidaceae bacterium]